MCGQFFRFVPLCVTKAYKVGFFICFQIHKKIINEHKKIIKTVDKK